jgi:L-amino acid N-acyltransferase YncA
MIIRDALEEDLPAIVEIYNAATATRRSTALFGPVSVAERLPWFHRHSPDQFPLWVAEVGSQIAVGLAFTSSSGDRLTMARLRLAFTCTRIFGGAGSGGSW